MVSSYLALLRKQYHHKLDEDAKVFLDFAADGAVRMKALVEGLLNYSRVGSKTLSVKLVDLNALVERAKLNLKEAIRESESQIIIEVPLPTIVADEIQLIQVFQNLMANAIKFCSNRNPRINIGFESTPDESIFSVSDNGIGIADGDLDRIFKMFHRLQGRSEYPGTGLGLATCKKIVERHGGGIWVKSTKERGSTFFFSIPRRLRSELSEGRSSEASLEKVSERIKRLSGNYLAE